jgi:hypothetical protein
LFCVGLVEKELLSFQNTSTHPLFATHKTGGEFMCSGKIAVLSLLATHKTGGEFMCSGKRAVLSLLVQHKTRGEFMCSGKIAVQNT